MRRRSREVLADLRSAPPPPLYYLGRTFAGLPLTHADRRGGRAHFVYGSCDWVWHGDYGTCRVAQVQVQQFSFDPLALEAAAGCRRLEPVRGVPTVWHGGLALIAGETVVKVSGRDADETRRAARLLHTANAGVAAGDALPSPDAATIALVGKACGARPGDRGPRQGDPSVLRRTRPGRADRARRRLGLSGSRDVRRSAAVPTDTPGMFPVLARRSARHRHRARNVPSRAPRGRTLEACPSA